MRRLVIVRHGDTFAAGEPPRRIGRRTDLSLTAAGRAQAAALAADFARRGWRFDRVLAGPLRRTRETAALLAEAHDVADWLAEIDHGPDEDRPEDEVRARLGAAALAAWDGDATLPADWRADTAALRSGWRALAALPGTSLAVTSSGVARFALLALGATGFPLKLRTGAFGVVEDGQPVAWDQRP
jgi:broad specificity phosphatase PhoE